MAAPSDGRVPAALFRHEALGVVFQVRDEKNGRPVTRGYLMMHPPEGIARLDAVLQFAVRGPDRPDPAEGHLAAGDGGAAVMDPELERVASVAWVLTLLRNHGDWSDAMVASVTGADEAEVRQVRAELESWDAQCREPR